MPFQPCILSVGLVQNIGQVNLGSLVSSVMFGYLVNRYGNYDLPFIPMAVLLVIAAFLWLKIDATRQLIPNSSAKVIP